MSEAGVRRRPPALLLARAYLAVVLARPLARLSPRLLRRALLRRRPWRVPAGTSERTVVEAVDYVLGSGWPFVRGGCLPRGIALYGLLATTGSSVTLTFGVDRTLRSDGHCWLERDGVPLYERADPNPRFVAVWQVPPAPL